MRVPGRFKGVEEKSKSPKIYAYMERLGLAHVVRRRFKVILAWLIKGSHSDRGKLGSHDANPTL